MTDHLDSSRPLQAFRDEMKHLGVVRYLVSHTGGAGQPQCAFPLDQIRSDEDIYRRYLTPSSAAMSSLLSASSLGGEAVHQWSEWIRQAFPLAGERGAASHAWCGLVGAGVTGIEVTSAQAADALVARAASASTAPLATPAERLQQYYLNHFHMWNGALVRVLIPKTKYDSLVHCNPALVSSAAVGETGLPPPSSGAKIYRVGMIRAVSLVAGGNTGDGPSSTISKFVLDRLIPMLRFTVDFGDCSDEQCQVKYVSNDPFSQEEFDIFRAARDRIQGRGAHTPSWLSHNEATTLRIKLVQGRLVPATTYPLTTDADPESNPTQAHAEHAAYCAAFYPSALLPAYLGSPIAAYVQAPTITNDHSSEIKTSHRAEAEDAGVAHPIGRYRTALDCAFSLLVASVQSEVGLTKPVLPAMGMDAALTGGNPEAIASVARRLTRWCNEQAERTRHGNDGADGAVCEMDRSKLASTAGKLASTLRGVVGPQIDLLEMRVEAALAAKALAEGQRADIEDSMDRAERAYKHTIDALEADKKGLQQAQLRCERECAAMTEKLTQLERNSKTLVAAYKDVERRERRYKGLNDEVVTLLGMKTDASPDEILEMLKRRITK